MGRDLAAQFLPVVGGRVVAVDRLQPVAALLTLGGTPLDVVSWADRRDPPAEWVWPNRRVAVVGDRVLVQDLPDERPVALVVGDGRFRRVEDAPDAGPEWRYPRLFRAVPTAVRGWTFGGQRIGNGLWCWVERNGRRWTAGAGSVVAHAVEPSWAVAAIRRAPVRPWAFSPAHELVALAAGPDRPVPTAVAPIPVDEHCWPVRGDRERVLAEYLPWTENLQRVIAACGGRDVRRTVHGPSVDIAFRLGDHALVLHDEPLDELGRPVGLHFWDLGIDDLDALPGMTLTELLAYFDSADRRTAT